MGEGTTELIKFSIAGVNVIPTALLLLTQCYWIIASLGFFDLEMLNVDIEGGETSGLLNVIAMFIEFGQVPITLVLSILSLNFWISMMLTYFLPIVAGGIISAILLLPVFILSVLVTKYQVHLLQMSVFEKKSYNDIAHRVLNKQCILLGDLENGQLSQAEIKENGVSIVINVCAQKKDVSFKKKEDAIVDGKDEEKNVYYIIKS